MKVPLDNKDDKVHHLTEALKTLSDEKAQTPTVYKAKVLEDLKEAVEEMNLIKAGKLAARDAEDLFDEL